MKASLVNALRKGTQVLLSIDSQDITLIPHARVKKPGGVYDWEAQPARPAQKFQVEPVESTLTGITGAGGGIAGGDGAQAHNWSYVLRGRYDAQVAIGDVWQAGETSYRVVSIQPFNNYEKTAVVSAIGKDPSYGA
jgi:hypothetical protein